jgi:hypothetical protein
MNRGALFGSPDHLFIQNLAALGPQSVDYPLALIEVIPKQTSIEEVKLALAISEDLAQARIVEQEPPGLIYDTNRGWGELQQLPELTLVLGRFCSESRRAVACCRSRYVRGHVVLRSRTTGS